MGRKALAAMTALAGLLGGWLLACDSGDDDDSSAGSGQQQDDDDGAPAGDDDNDNDASPADDDDDTAPYTCEKVAQGMEEICHMVADWTPDEIDVTFEEWCGLSEALFPGKPQAPYWLCMGECAWGQSCEGGCRAACESPPDPGGNGCDHAVHGLYSCGIVFIYEANENYWIPELDLQAACSGSLNDRPWACYGECAATLSCSSPPAPAETQAMIDCLDAC